MEAVTASPEVWLPVAGYEGFYEASNLGRIRRAVYAKPSPGTQAGRVLKPGYTHGYAHVSLSRDGVIETLRVHRLVLVAFCGGEPFDGAQICHNNGKQDDCRLVNLRWDSAAGNQADRVRHSTDIRGEAVFGAKLTEDEVRQIRKRIATGKEVAREIAEDFGVSPSTIHLIGKDRIWRHVQ